MELTTAMKNRRSIRTYKEGKTVDKSTVEALIQAAQLAPSWKNSQTARYYAILSTEKIQEVAEQALPEFNRNNCKNAGALIVTTFVKNRAGFDREGNPDNELGNEWGAYDLGLANQNLLLKATELGLGTLVMGIRDAQVLRTALNIPDDQIVVSVISVGEADVDPEMPKRKDVDAIVTFF